MGFMEQVAAKMATKYGVVTSGKYEGCQIALGNPPEEKAVTAEYVHFSQIIFVDGSEEKGRYWLNRKRTAITMRGHNETGVQMTVSLEDGEICDFDLLVRSKDKLWMKLVKTFFGQKGGVKTSDKGGVDATIQEEQELRFHNMIVFFLNAVQCMTPNEIDFFEGYFADNSVLDDKIKRRIEIYREVREKEKVENNAE